MSLLELIHERTQSALKSGALLPIATEGKRLFQHGINFSIRVAVNLQKKDDQKKEQSAHFNPFLPYDQALFVCDISNSHVCLLNKFNVLENHSLIVTRRFEHQNNLLTIDDFQALYKCMAQFNSLGFYNGGIIAGASQEHKHLQLIPLPLVDDEPGLPIDKYINQIPNPNTIQQFSKFHFDHGFVRFDSASFNKDPVSEMQYWYTELLRHTKVKTEYIHQEWRHQTPYNLLVTKTWMGLIPRSTEFYKGISVNSLGFVGSFFVRDETQMQVLYEDGPLEVLRQVSLTD